MSNGVRDEKSPTPTYDSTFAVVMGIVLINEALSLTVAMPYVGLLVASFSTGGNNDAAGYYSGLVIGVFQLAQIFLTPTWGKLSDRFGRRPIIVTGLASSAVAVLGFGFSTSLAWALVWRFLHGALSANVAVAKSAIVEATDRNTEAKGFAMMTMTFSVGCMIGPALGGLLYAPCVAYEGRLFANGSIFCTYPALLPSVLVALYAAVAAKIAFDYLPETNQHANELTVSGVSEVLGLRSTPTDANGQTASSSKPSLSLADCFRNRLTRTLLVNYMIICGPNVVFAECLPLFAIAIVGSGGLGLTSKDVGIVFSINGIAMFAGSFVFPRLAARYDRLPLWRGALVGWALSLMLYPVVGTLRRELELTSLGVVVLLCLVGIPRSVFSTSASSLSVMFIGASAPSGQTGALMGVSQSLASASRCVTPMLFAPLFAWSIARPRPFPLDSYFVFILGALMMAWPFYSTLRLVASDVTKPVVDAKSPPTPPATSHLLDVESPRQFDAVAEEIIV